MSRKSSEEGLTLLTHSLSHPTTQYPSSSPSSKPSRSWSTSDYLLALFISLLLLSLSYLLYSNLSPSFHRTPASPYPSTPTLLSQSPNPSNPSNLSNPHLISPTPTPNQTLPTNPPAYNPYENLLLNYHDNAIAPKAHILPVSPGPTIKFALVGDINLARNVFGRIKTHQMDYTFPLQKIKPYLDGIDIKYGNLESGITESHKTKKPIKDCATSKSKCCGLRCHFKTSPHVLDGVVEYAGFNVLSIENNHIEDWQGGREDTQKTLDQFNVAWIDSSHPYKLKDFKGCNIDFFAYDITFTNGMLLEFKKIAMVSVLRTANQDAFKVVCVHGGQEYKPYYNKAQQTFAEAAIDNGADMVVMSHAHVTQPYVMYKGKYIFYGLGNFVFDQHFSMRVREFLMATFELKDCKEVINMEVWNGLLNKQFQPEIVSLNMTTREVKNVLPSGQKLRGV